MWVNSMTLGYVNYNMRPREESKNICLQFIHSCRPWKVGWSYTLGTMCKNHCSSQYYSHETLFIPILLPYKDYP